MTTSQELNGALNPTWVEWLMGQFARVDRLKGLGNAIVLAIAEWIILRSSRRKD